MAKTKLKTIEMNAELAEAAILGLEMKRRELDAKIAELRLIASTAQANLLLRWREKQSEGAPSALPRARRWPRRNASDGRQSERALPQLSPKIPATLMLLLRKTREPAKQLRKPLLRQSRPADICPYGIPRGCHFRYRDLNEEDVRTVNAERLLLSGGSTPFPSTPVHRALSWTAHDDLLPS